MRILILSDIHANLNALEAVLDAAGEVDATWCLGDLVGYGPDPNECINRIRSTPNLTCLLGNHDAAAIGYIDTLFFNREARLSAQWMKSHLSRENIAYLKSLPDRCIIGDVTLVHGSPRNPVWEYLLDRQAAAINFSYFNTKYCFVGHTHLPVAYIEEQNDVKSVKLEDHQVIAFENRIIINPGSVGQPRDRDKRASFAIYQPPENLWEIHRVDYDFHSVQQRIINAGLPRRHAQRLAEGW